MGATRAHTHAEREGERDKPHLERDKPTTNWQNLLKLTKLIIPCKPMFKCFVKVSSGSPRLHLLDEKYSKNSNVKKC